MPTMAPPDARTLRETRSATGLSQSAAAALIGSTLRTWQDWEAGKAAMHPGLWELFRHLTGIKRIPFRRAGGVYTGFVIPRKITKKTA
jgi:transcriptional regulator with XRE-family HTH domain